MDSTINNSPIIEIDEAPGFPAAKGNVFTLDASNTYDPDGYDVFYYWEANVGLGLGCLDGVSSSEESCCIDNPIKTLGQAVKLLALGDVGKVRVNAGLF